MDNVLLFAGTTEGRMFAEYLASNEIPVCACVATEYGKELIEAYSGIEVHAGRLSAGEMERLMERFACVVDATHPYAQKATQNIREACLQSGKQYFRLLREEQKADGCIYVRDIAEAVQILNQTQGKILVTTGSKEAEKFTAVDHFKERIVLRILPSAAAIEACVNLGYPAKNLVCMQGPFSEELNLAMLRHIGARYLVTKESGSAGGFSEKILAAAKADVSVIVVGRPAEEQGFSLKELERMFAREHQPKGDRMFPLFMSLRDKKVRIFGGGRIAERRANTLAEFGCRIEVISPHICAGLRRQQIEWKKGRFCAGESMGADLVIAATNDREVNRIIGEECRNAGIPVSVADSREECTFYFPAVALHGSITIGITADGKDHALVKNTAQKIRILLEKDGK